MGFFDLAIAAPPMKAALEAWGSKSNLFHQRFAKGSDDPRVIAATLNKPGDFLDCEIVCLAAAAGEHHLISAAPMRAATSPRARSNAAFAGALAQWPLEGLPKASLRNDRIAATTAGSIGLLAL